MNKNNFFKEELNYIKNNKIREYAEKAINELPDYFFEIPASSTGKYHPDYSQGNGGLVRHVKACVRFGVECFRLEWYSDFSETDKDLMVVAWLLHDGWKSGKEKQQYTVADHPIVAINELKSNKNLEGILPEDYLNIIYDNIETHMGSWRFDKSGKAFAPSPQTKMQKLIHFVDYVCSRKMFEVNFDCIPER